MSEDEKKMRNHLKGIFCSKKQNKKEADGADYGSFIRDKEKMMVITTV